ncbi:catalase [Syncephalis plumigaleata]|nr:catalase [Syncephalis plumigaleata]
MTSVLTTANGNPVDDNQTTMTAGPTACSGRVVHAKGAGAHGYFEVTHDFSNICRANLCRFSTVSGEKGSADTARDPRGFAMKFILKKASNWDMVANNTPVFFIRDPSKFPDFVHILKRNPQTNLLDANMFWDFLSLVPESVHQVTIMFSDRGTPDGYRHMHGFSSHTFKMVDSEGKFKFVKWHFLTDQGIKNLTMEEATKLAGTNPDYATEDLFRAIERGDYPSWTAYVQVMEPKDAATYRWNPFDVTKVWPHADYPLEPVGKLVLNRNPVNYFAEVEQAAFSPSHLVPGIDVTNDKMLQSRLFSYTDTQFHRLGGNFRQIPINMPYAARVANHQRDGPMTVNDNGGFAPNYEPNSFGGPKETKMPSDMLAPEEVSGFTGRHVMDLVDDDFVQPGLLYNLQTPDEKTRLISNIVTSLSGAKVAIQDRMVGVFKRADAEYGRRVEEGLLAIRNKQDM